VSRSNSIEELFDVLGNKTRRRILELLSKEPQYITQLKDMLPVRAQAIWRHLRILEQCGLVHTYERASLGGPPRKYYSITNVMNANVHIGPNSFSLKLFSDSKGKSVPKSLIPVPMYKTSDSSSNILLGALQLVLDALSREKPTKEIETTVSVLESLKKSLIGDIH